MPAKLLFKYTSRNRVSNFFRGLDSIVDNLANKNDYFILCSFDVDDSQYLHKEFTERLDKYENLKYYYGISNTKIEAINRDIPLAPHFDILVNFSDDQIFTVQGFDDIIRNAAETNFKDTDFFLHFHDFNQPRLATMSVIGREWFLRTNYIYHPSYITEYCDLEEQEKAIRLKKYKYMGGDLKIMCHIHPYFGFKEAMDELYRVNMIPSELDRKNYFKRLANNFDL